MTVEAAGFIDDIDPTQPPGTDNFSEGDNHLRNFKKSVQDSLPNITGAMSATHTELNNLDGYTGNTADLNILSGADAAGLTAAELQYVKDVTSDIQDQLNTKHTSGGTDVPIADGGTGSSTASGARTNLGLGTLSTLSSVAAGQIDANSVRMSEIYTAIGAYASPNVSPGAVWSAPEDGIYFLKTTSASIFEHQILFNGVWTFTGEYVSNSTPNQFLVISSSVRIKNTSGSPAALSYQRVLG